MSGDKITVTHTDGREAEFELSYRGLTIGSGSTNDVILSGSGVSQQHLRITFDPTGYHILPLPRSLPVHLDERQLLPSVEQLWRSGQVLQVGENRLCLVAAETPQVPAGPSPVEPPPASRPDIWPWVFGAIGLLIVIALLVWLF